MTLFGMQNGCSLFEHTVVVKPNGTRWIGNKKLSRFIFEICVECRDVDEVKVVSDSGVTVTIIPAMVRDGYYRGVDYVKSISI